MTATDIKQDDENMKDGAVGIIYTCLPSVHSRYQSRAREAGKVVLEIEDFWNKFRRRFPGSREGQEPYYPSIQTRGCGTVVFVGLRPTDSDLAAECACDGLLTSEAEVAILDAFIEGQDLFPSAPYPGDGGFEEWFRQNLLSGKII